MRTSSPNGQGGPVPPSDAKIALRKAAAAARADAQAAAPKAGEALAARYGELGVRAWPGQGTVVAGYAPIRSEIDPWPLLRVLQDAGADLAMPRVDGEDLVFHGISDAGDLTPGAFGVPEPSRNAPRLTPDIVLVPCLAFDAFGHRLGYGKGFYDRALASLRSGGELLAVLLAFAAQERSDLPVETHDRPVDAIATETGARWVGRSEGKETE